MPTNKQERERARRNLQQQLERRKAAEARRRKTAIGVTVVATIAVIGVVLALVIGLTGGSDDSTPVAAGSDGATPTTAAGTSTGPCGYSTSANVGANTDLKDVGLPPDPDPTPTENRALSFTTNLGTLTMELDGAGAPCNVQSVSFLAQKGFYDGVSCHRLVTSGIFVLQCGDPSETGRGGPTYNAKDENLAAADYSEGVVAMANSGPNTNSSQFFIMTKDSPSLPKSYTVIGKVTAGLDLVQKVAAAGTADGSTDGKPKEPLTLEKATVTPPISLDGASGGSSCGAASSAPATVGSASGTPGASGSPAQ